MEEKDKIVFYIAVNPPPNMSLPYDVDVSYCPIEWSKIKVRNYFKRRNPEWDFKKTAYLARII